MDLARNLIQRINVGDSLTRSAAARPGHLAVVDGARRWTYTEFNGWVNQVSHGLAARGYTRGDALGLASANSAEFLAVYFACAKLGLVCGPVNLGWRPDEVAYVLDHSGARGLLGHHLVPQGRGGQPRGHLPGVDGQRAGLAVEPHRPVRGHDADVSHRAAERVLHARRHGRRDHLRAARFRPGGPA